MELNKIIFYRSRISKMSDLIDRLKNSKYPYANLHIGTIEYRIGIARKKLMSQLLVYNLN